MKGEKEHDGNCGMSAFGSRSVSPGYGDEKGLTYVIKEIARIFAVSFLLCTKKAASSMK